MEKSVKVGGVLSRFRCYFDMQNAVVDGEAHKKDPCKQIMIKVRVPDTIQRGYQGRSRL